MWEERTPARVRAVPPSPPFVDTGPTPVDFWTSEPLDMTKKGAAGTTPGQMKGEKVRDDLMNHGIAQGGAHYIRTRLCSHSLVYSTFIFTLTSGLEGLRQRRPRLLFGVDRLEFHKTNRTPSAIATSKAKKRENNARCELDNGISWKKTLSAANVCAPIRFASQPRQ